MHCAKQVEARRVNNAAIAINHKMIGHIGSDDLPEEFWLFDSKFFGIDSIVIWRDISH
jgi:hypothetical protein